MSEKYYILHYPSSLGMGTNTDIRLVSDCDIRRLIRAELDKKMKNNRFDDRFTGTWNEEKFCDSDDIEEVVEDVIYKRLNTNSTYAPANDLVIVPNSVPIIRTDFEIKNTIFRICNQFDCVTDVIAGEGIFRRYILDLQKCEKLGILEGGHCYDFLGYDMKRVLTTGLWSDCSTLVKQYERKLEWLGKEKSSAMKIDEQYKKYLSESIKEAHEALEKFANITPMKDEYNDFILKVGSGNAYIDEIINEFDRKEKRDYTRMAFMKPVLPHEFGQIWHDEPYRPKYFTYSELFRNGSDVEWLTASLTGDFDLPENCGEIQPFYALVPVFAGD